MPFLCKNQFEQCILKTRRGKLPEDNLLFFMISAKRYFDKLELSDKVSEINALIDEWRYWCSVKRGLDSTYGSFISLAQIERYSIPKYSKLGSYIDSRLRQFALGNTSKFRKYIEYLINIKQRELFYEILTDIWLLIYARSLITDAELINLISGLRLEEQSSTKDFSITYQVDASIDEGKERIKPKEIKPTPICLRRIVRLMRPFLEDFRSAFFKEVSIDTRLYNAVTYCISLLMVTNKVMQEQKIGDLSLNEILSSAYDLAKLHETYRYMIRLRKSSVTPSERTIIEEQFFALENTLRRRVEELFAKTEDIISELMQVAIRPSFGELEGKKAIVTYRPTRSPKEEEKKHLVGFELKYDDLIAILDDLKSGGTLRDVEIDCRPFTMYPENMPPITMTIGQMGSGKTIHMLCYAYSLLNSGYSVFDISLNPDRSAEYIFCSMPLNEKLSPDEFEKLTELQEMYPKKFNMFFIVPNYGTLPRIMPAGTKVVTIPLYQLANRMHALSLLFTEIPTADALELVNLILTTQADVNWNLDTLRTFMTRLLNMEEPEITVKDKIGTLVFRKRTPIEKNIIKKAMRRLVKSSSIISSGRAETVIDFDELTQRGVFVVPYIGHIPDRIFSFAFITWLFYSILDYKAHNKEKKIAININEAQNIVASQALIGGIFSQEKYSIAMDIASNCLQWRGMGFKALLNTQMAGQLKEQLRTQAGAKVVFHTTYDNDLDYAFGDIFNPQLRDNLKALVKSKFFKDEHLAALVLGPEDVHVLVGAVPPCQVELVNVDPFKLYYDQYPTDIVDTRTFTKMLEKDLEDTFLTTMKPEIGKTIEIIERGQKVAGISEGEKIIDEEELERMTKTPEGKAVVPEKMIVGGGMKQVPKDMVAIPKPSEDEMILRLKKFPQPMTSRDEIYTILLYLDPSERLSMTKIADLDDVSLNWVSKVTHSSKGIICYVKGTGCWMRKMHREELKKVYPLKRVGEFLYEVMTLRPQWKWTKEAYDFYDNYKKSSNGLIDHS